MKMAFLFLPQEISKEVLLETEFLRWLKTLTGKKWKGFIVHPGAVVISATTQDDKLL